MHESTVNIVDPLANGVLIQSLQDPLGAEATAVRACRLWETSSRKVMLVSNWDGPPGTARLKW